MSGVKAGAADGVVALLKKSALLNRVNQESGAAIHAGLEQLDALFGGHPALDHHIIQLLAQKLIHHGLIRAAHLEKIRQRPHRRHALSQRAGLQQPAHRFGGVAVVANQRLQSIAASGHGGLFAAQLVGVRAQRIFFGAAGLQSLAQGRNLALQPLERLRRGLKALPCLSALRAQVFQLHPRLAHLGFQPLRLAFQSRQTLFALGRMIAGVAGQGQQVHGLAAAGL